MTPAAPSPVVTDCARCGTRHYGVTPTACVFCGEDPASAWPERAEWRRLAAAEGWRCVDTGRARAVVEAEVLTWARGML